MEDGIFSDNDNFQCLPYLPNRAVGVCHITLNVQGVATRVGITVSERDNGPATDVGVVRLK